VSKLAGIVAIVVLSNLAITAITVTVIERRDNGVVAELRAEHTQEQREQAAADHWASTP
jgi:hypothetical protein